MIFHKRRTKKRKTKKQVLKKCICIIPHFEDPSMRDSLVEEDASRFPLIYRWLQCPT